MSKILLAAAFLCCSVASAEVPFVNWENHPQHPLDLSPDGTTLAVTHTADARVQLFDVTNGIPSPAGHVLVGLDPVSARFRNDEELWVVNHISDSISIVDVSSRALVATLQTEDEPYDVVFAGGKAYVSCSQANRVLVFDATSRARLDTIDIAGEDPRALATSADQSEVYVAIFESGNGSTVLSGATTIEPIPPNAVSLPESPYGGENPPPNSGNDFLPRLADDLGTPPRVAHIVRKDENGRWADDNGGDWTAFVSGNAASQSGRVPGWDLPDRDIAIIDVGSDSVRYVSRLLNIGMALTVEPVSGDITLVGTDASNEVRFEPNLNGVYATVELARVSPAGGNAQRVDLNPHLDYLRPTIPQSERNRSIGDPRGIVWRSDGARAYVTGMGSNNVITIDSEGQRVGETIEAGEGPTGLALSADESLLYVWNHFEASISVIDITGGEEIERVEVFNPLPSAIRQGRKHLYDTRETSGLGHVACATCHVDARTDRLAWDLGDPGGEVKEFNQNCFGDNGVGFTCRDFHPMKGPMLTQTLQDIIGHEPLHWRGDRDGLEEFNATYDLLQGDDERLSAAEMQELENFLSTITLPPNPFRNLDNSLSTSVDLRGQVTSDRFGTPGRPFGSGNAARGLERYTTGFLQRIDQFQTQANCSICHSLPTGMAVNGPIRDVFQDFVIGGQILPTGPNGENHLGVISQSTNQGRTMKVPQLRTLYERTGFSLSERENQAGFGFLHDGSIGTLADFLSLPDFQFESDQDIADMIAFLLSFSGSDLPTQNDAFDVAPPLSQDSHAAVGQQETFPNGSQSRLATFAALAEAGRVDLVAHLDGTILPQSYRYTDGAFEADNGTGPISLNDLRASATETDPVTFTVVPAGLGGRFGQDRDGDGIANGIEFQQGSDPADASSRNFAPIQGLWYNPGRAGHGIDLQRAGDTLVATWYTYEEDGTPVWYQAVASLAGREWSAVLERYTRDPAGGPVIGEAVGELEFSFDSARRAELCWRVDEQRGCEPFQRFAFAEGFVATDYTGLWFDPEEPGYGLSIDSQANTRVVVVYYYDSENQPRWVIGQGDNAADNAITMRSFEGFCPACTSVATTSVEAGAVGLSFSDPRNTHLSLDIEYPRDGSLFARSEAALVPLTNVPVNYGR